MTITDVLAIASPLVAIAVALLTNRRGQKSDDSTAAREQGVIHTEIKHMKSQLGRLVELAECNNARTDAKLGEIDAKVNAQIERNAATEQIAKSAHKRLDALEGK